MPNNTPLPDNNRGIPYEHEPDQFGATPNAVLGRIMNGEEAQPGFWPLYSLSEPPLAGQTLTLRRMFDHEPQPFLIVHWEIQKDAAPVEYGSVPIYNIWVREP